MTSIFMNLIECYLYCKFKLNKVVLPKGIVFGSRHVKPKKLWNLKLFQWLTGSYKFWMDRAQISLLICYRDFLFLLFVRWPKFHFGFSKTFFFIFFSDFSLKIKKFLIICNHPFVQTFVRLSQCENPPSLGDHS